MAILNKDDLTTLVKNLVNHYGFPESEDTTEAIATVILHAPPDMGDLELGYIGSRVSKMMANKVAYEFIQELKEKRAQAAKPADTQQPEAASGSIQNQQVQG